MGLSVMRRQKRYLFGKMYIIMATNNVTAYELLFIAHVIIAKSPFSVSLVYATNRYPCK